MSMLGVRHDQRTIQISNSSNYLLPAAAGNRPLARNFARFSRRRRRRSISRRLSIFLCLATKVSFLSFRIMLEKKAGHYYRPRQLFTSWELNSREVELPAL